VRCEEYGCYVSVRAQGGEAWSLQLPLRQWLIERIVRLSKADRLQDFYNIYTTVHGGTVASQQEGPWFEPQFVCSPRVSVGLLQAWIGSFVYVCVSVLG